MESNPPYPVSSVQRRTSFAERRRPPSFLYLRKRMYVAGHTGMLGGALLRALQEKGATNLLTATHEELDLCNQAATEAFFAKEKPDYVFMAAAKVGGIMSHAERPATFIADNLLMAAHVFASAHNHGVKRLMFVASSCVYPRHAPQPMREEHLMQGPLEPSIESYAMAKLAGIKLCEAYCDQYDVAYFSVLPTNLYGPNDRYDSPHAHVLAALLSRMHQAKEEQLPHVEVWGTGKPRRAFMHVDDCAEACLVAMDRWAVERHAFPSFINLGCDDELSVSSLARLIKKIVGYQGSLVFDPLKPDGVMRKRLDNTRLLGLGFRTKISLEEGIKQIYESQFLHT